MEEILARIQSQVQENDMVLYMKGTPQFPQCGFSGQVVDILKKCSAQYAYVNVLADQAIREMLPKFSDWPTFPQLFIKGTLVGGCDIVVELYETAQLQKMLDAAGLVLEKPKIVAA